MTGRSERGRDGQDELTDHEREAIDFSWTSVPCAKSVKGIVTEQGDD
ncbi:hypothetical protein [Natrinema gelatinilyticum]|nr:hypothetical protein [Natrinema gelatinilyticum]